MANSSSSSSSGIGFTGLLTVAFIVLKLCNVIAWDWVWVLSPIWISAALVCTILLGIVCFYAITDKKYKPKKFEPKSRTTFAQKMEEAMEKQRHAESN